MNRKETEVYCKKMWNVRLSFQNNDYFVGFVEQGQILGMVVWYYHYLSFLNY